MRRPRSPMIRRPKMTSAATILDSKQAAMHLVRLEFEIDRLERAIGTAQKNAATHELELATHMAERAKLMAVLQKKGE